MALKLKTEFLKQSRDGRSITLRDATGLFSLDNLGGYGVQNPGIESIISYYFIVSRFYGQEDFVLHIDGTNPRLPTPLQIANGKEVVLNTDLLESGDGLGSSFIFVDGILDVNMYVEFPGMNGVTITADTKAIYGGDFTEALKADAVLVNGVIYEIDRGVPLNGSTVLYVTEEFTESATSFTSLYRSNVKVLADAMSRDMHDYACKRLRNTPKSNEWIGVNTAASMRAAAYGFFNKENPDYTEANDLIVSNYKLIRKYSI